MVGEFFGVSLRCFGSLYNFSTRILVLRRFVSCSCCFLFADSGKSFDFLLIFKVLSIDSECWFLFREKFGGASAIFFAVFVLTWLDILGALKFFVQSYSASYFCTLLC